jgi:hypothetical protein
MTKTEEFRRAGLPYCLQRCDDGRWLVLNRNYKPIGVTSDEFVDYETCPGIRLRLTKAQLKKVSWKPEADLSSTVNKVWLYSDGCIPRHDARHQAAYAGRLMVLINAEARRPGRR